MTSAGQVFDLGYQPYQGARQGRPRALWAIYTSSLRAAFGIGRGGKAKIIPFTLLTLAIMPAAIALGIASLLGENFSPIKYANYLNTISILLSLFCATVAPELLCPDRRNRTLSLYFAHAITRLDYAVMKGLGLLTALLAMSWLPLLILFAGNTFAAKDGGAYLRANVGVLPRATLAALLVSLFLAMLSLAAASLTSRRIFAAGGFIALFLISNVVAFSIWETFKNEPSRYLILLNFAEFPFDAVDWIFNQRASGMARETGFNRPALFLNTLGWSAASLAVVVWRYLRWEP